MQLVVPSIKYKQSYLAAIEESRNETNVNPLSRLKENQSFEDFVQSKLDHAKGVNLPEGYVPYTEFWLIDNDEFIGRSDIRHILNEFLIKIGGQIGYWVRPSKRGKGYGKMLLKLMLIEAKKLGFSDILITCDVTNIASKKVIEDNGGVMENVVENGLNNPLKARYKIKT